MAVKEEGSGSQESGTQRGDLGFPVVGIGASAGGLAALQQLFAGMPAKPGMAFVVVMHLSPDHVSTLPQIIERSCHLPALAVTHSTTIEIDHIYVISPAKRLVMSDGHLMVSDIESMESRRSTLR